jgi:hypothetical protein
MSAYGKPELGPPTLTYSLVDEEVFYSAKDLHMLLTFFAERCDASNDTQSPGRTIRQVRDKITELSRSIEEPGTSGRVQDKR